MTNQERDGRFFLRFMFVLWIVAEVILISYSASKRGAGEFVFGGVRLVLTIGLMYAIMRGNSWAKWVFVVLVVVTSALLGLSLLLNPNVIIFCLTAYLVVLLYALLFSARVKAYLRHRRHPHGTLDEGGAA